VAADEPYDRNPRVRLIYSGLVRSGGGSVPALGGALGRILAQTGWRQPMLKLGINSI
jgi:hypothetical protein